MSLLTVEGLEARHGLLRAVRGVDLALGEGETLALVGANGAGKTTLLRTIMGLLACQSGRIRFEGRAIERLATHQRARLGLGYVPQGRQIFPALTVRENLLFGGIAKSGGGKSGADDILARILGDFPELKRLLDRPGGALSGGEQQLLALARALCGKPRLLLLDEPTLGLAPRLVDQVFEILEQLKQEGVTILLVEQNAARTIEIADRTYVLRSGGRLAFKGTARELAEMANFEQEYIGL
jgi:branched-chain amino acid transport system ATP-binding protein